MLTAALAEVCQWSLKLQHQLIENKKCIYLQQCFNLVYSLTQTNIEEKILIQSPHIITNEGGQISYKEFARRLEVPSTSEVLQQLFRMYDKVIIIVPLFISIQFFCLEISKLFYNAGT
jgi:hypothetical protein